MCTAMLSPISAIPGFNKPVSNIVNNTPVGYGYKAASGGQKLSDSVKDGSIYTGLAGAAMINRQNKSNQFSTAAT